MTVACELGPAGIRRLTGSATQSSVAGDAALAAAAIGGGDDPVVLFDGRAVDSTALWRGALRPLLAETAAVVLVHPSWWPPQRIATVGRIAAEFCAEVTTRSRSWLLAQSVSAPSVTVVEISAQMVTIADNAARPGWARPRTAPPSELAETVAQVLLRSGTGPARFVLIDGQAGVPGASVLAEMIADLVREAGQGAIVRIVSESLLRAAVRQAIPADPSNAAPAVSSGAWPTRRLRRPTAVLAAVAVTCAVVAAVSGAGPPGREAPETALVSGRVTMQIPATWTVERITSGPGSARVEVTSPVDPEAVLHLTQSPVPPGETPEATAATLRSAIDEQPPGVFVDLNPADTRAGRLAVTYREVRPRHDIRWVVLLDAAVRISIGCQSASGAEGSIASACQLAVESARVL